MRVFCCRLKLVRVIQSSAARYYVGACMFMKGKGKKESECMFGWRRHCMWLHKGILVKETEEGRRQGALLQWKYLTHGWLFIIADDCGTFRKPQERYSSSQRGDREGVHLLQYYSSISSFILLCAHSVSWNKQKTVHKTVNSNNAVTVKLLNPHCIVRTGHGRDQSSVTAESVMFGENALDS